MVKSLDGATLGAIAKLDDTHQKVEEMHAILLQAKGARWVIVGMAGVAGLASGLIAKLIP